MNTENQEGDVLEKAIATISNSNPPTELVARCLGHARSISVLSRKSDEKKMSFNTRSWSAAIVGIAALAVFSVAISTLFPSGIAVAQIESSLAAIKSLRIEIVDQESDEVINIRISEGAGYRLESANRLEVDNGEFRVEVDKTRKRGLKFPSKIKDGYQVRQVLDDWVGLPDHNSRDIFKRREDLDETWMDEKFECFAWSEELGRTQYESLAYRDSSKRIRMLSSRHRTGNDQPWQSDTLVRLHYDAIQKQEFDLELEPDIELVERDIKQVDLNGTSVDESVFAAHQQVVKQWPAYYGLKFEVQVRASRSYGPDVDKTSRVKCRAFPSEQVEYRDTYCVLAPVENSQRPRRFWKRYQLEKGKDILVSAVSFDGITTRSYTRGGQGSPRRGLVVLTEEMTPLDDIPNYYEQLLFLQLNLANNGTPITPDLAAFDLDRMHQVATHQRQNWLESEFAFYGESTSGLIAYEINAAHHPANRVVGYRIRLDRDGKQESLGSLELHRLSQFEGTWYPAAGVLQQTGFGLLDEFVYRFEVVDVSRLSQDAESSWWIEWPSGTIVNDQVEKRTYTVPPGSSQ